MMATKRPSVLRIVWLVVVWVALWRDVSAANLLSGLLVALGVLWMFPPPDRPGVRIRPLALLRFIVTAAIAVVKANIVVAWEVMTPVNHTRKGVVAVELSTRHPVVITMISHAIILAPGTMIIDILLRNPHGGDDDYEPGGDGEDAPTVMYVHVLHLDSQEAVRDEVLRLEKLACAAVAPDTLEADASGPRPGPGPANDDSEVSS